MRIAFSELSSLPAEQRARRVAALARASEEPPNGELREVENRIAALEAAHLLTSDDLRRELAQGRRRETLEICRWLMLLDLRDHLASVAARPR